MKSINSRRNTWRRTGGFGRKIHFGVSVAAMVVSFAALSGCQAERKVAFEPNMVFAKGIEIQSGYPMQDALNQTQDALTRMFGTPSDPQLPKLLKEADYAELISLERVKAAGHSEKGVGLYQKHCATCHGVVGNGRGTTASLLDPYPRDYRAGKFKYKSTPRGVKPLRGDLDYVIRHGVDGTSMKAIPELKDDDIKVLVDYVIYLSIRGELERNLLRAAEDVDFEKKESLFDVKLESAEPDKFAEQLTAVEETLAEIGESWLEAMDQVKDVPQPAADLPVPATRAEVLAAKKAVEDSPLKKSIERGAEVFRGETAACAKCHGKEGYGDGQNQDYDDWTKEWTVRIGVDPADEAAQIPLIARGALPARRILPRDFRLGLLRGGSEPEKIYRRIAEGIDGTPMPAAALPVEDIWHLVNYVRSLDIAIPEGEAVAKAPL